MKKLYFSLLCICFVLCSLTAAQAQKAMYGGQLKDGAYDEPIIGANIIVSGTTVGTTSDFEGNFKISANKGDVLVISYLGYQDVEVTLAGNQMLGTIIMESDSDVIEDVVVVGYGVQKKASSVGAIATASGDDILKAGITGTVSEALQGQMPGVISISTTSEPGASEASLFIRGKSTWDNASPLVLVDGIERDFNDVDPNEIESISVLKDASATAVYGVKGANGVILLTTKRGDTNKAKISFSQNVGIQSVSASPEYADYVTSMKRFNQAQGNDQNWGGLIAESTIAAWENAYATGNYGPYNDVFPEVNWWDELISDTGLKTTTNLNVRGGSEKVQYFVSLGYQYDGGIFEKFENKDYDSTMDYRRYNWRSNLDFQITNTTKVSVNIAGSLGNQTQAAYRGSATDGKGQYFYGALLTYPTNIFPIKYSDGEWGDGLSRDQNLLCFMETSGTRSYKTINGFYDFSLKQDLKAITKGLTFNAKLSYTTKTVWYSRDLMGYDIFDQDYLVALQAVVRYNRVYDYSNPIQNPDGSISYPLLSESRYPGENSYGPLPVTPMYDDLSTYSRDLYYEANLHYARTFGDHAVSALAVFNRKMSQAKAGFPAYEEDWVGRITYNYKEKYLFEANGAYTGSEKFAPGKRFGFFPSASIGWRISEEPWVKKITNNKLSNLKLRYSYGIVGNDNGASRFNYIQSFTQTANNAQFGHLNSMNWGPLYTEGALADENATWETAVKQNIGLEVGYLGKLNLTLDLFDEQREGILMTRNSVPAWADSGVEFPEVNLGETKSHGFEVEVSYNNRIGTDFTYYVKYAIAASENRIVYRDDAYDLADYQKAAGKSIGYVSKYLATGNFDSLDDIYNSAQSQITNGLHSSLIAEDLYYLDYNGDGYINAQDQAPVDELNYPLTTQSLTFGCDYKGIGFSMLWYNAADVYKEQISAFLWDFPSTTVKAQTNTWEAGAGGVGATAPSLHLVNNYNQSASTYTYSDHSYIRLKNVEISYQFPKRIVSKAFMSSLQIYANGTNLLTFSPCDKQRDPETGGQNVYPMVKTYNFGVRIGF